MRALRTTAPASIDDQRQRRKKYGRRNTVRNITYSSMRRRRRDRVFCAVQRLLTATFDIARAEHERMFTISSVRVLEEFHFATTST